MTARKGKVVEESDHHPIKLALSAFGGIAIVIGVFFTIDDRYAHAGDIRALSTQLEVNRLTAEVSVLEIRRSTLQDKVYEGKSRNARSRSDVEILDRYQRELADVERQIELKRQQINGGRK